MTQAAKAQEPSMEEILASIRRIIADDDAARPPQATEAAKPADPAPPAPARATEQPTPLAAQPAASPAPAPAAVSNSQADIDALFAKVDTPPSDRFPVAKPATDDILDLTEDMQTSTPAPPAFRKIDGEPDVVFNEADPEPPAPVIRPMIEQARCQLQQEGQERSLLSPAASAAVDSAFNALAQTVLMQNSRTLDDLVCEMLRPMLKSWLDDNLPHMVERLVRAEIERVSRGRG
jgi:cell pole-organizing protein PopZ